MVGSGLQPEPLVWLSIMPSIRISKEFASGIYYLTFTVRNWYYLFDRHNRFQILAYSLQYVLKLFDMGNGRYEFWERTNMPKMIKSEEYLFQKIRYIHVNPIRK